MRPFPSVPTRGTWCLAASLGFALGAAAAEGPATTPDSATVAEEAGSSCPVPTAAAPAVDAPILWQADTGG